MSKAFQRELKLFFLIPKNIYLPISIFGIIFVIFLVLDLDNSLNYASSFIASFITIFIISENSFKDDHINGYLEQKLCEGGISVLIFYLMAKWITNLFFVFTTNHFLCSLHAPGPLDHPVTTFSGYISNHILIKSSLFVVISKPLVLISFKTVFRH